MSSLSSISSTARQGIERALDSANRHAKQVVSGSSRGEEQLVEGLVGLSEDRRATAASVAVAKVGEDLSKEVGRLLDTSA